MAETGEASPALFVQADTGDYVAYEPPDPPAFSESLPEDLRGNEHLQGVDDGATLARYYVDMKKDYLAPPETADGYEYDKPDGFNVDESALSEFRKVAFENNLNQKQFTELLNLEASRDKAAKESLDKHISESQEAAVQQLKTEWGDNYEKKLEAANSFLNHESLADDGFKKFLVDSRFGDNPNVIRFFAKVSELISEDVFQKPGNGADSNPVKRTEDGRPMLNYPSMQK